MTSKNKSSGNALERRIVKIWESAPGCTAKRAYASNGQSLGHHEEVDVLVTYPKSLMPVLNLSWQRQELKIQCKKKAKLPEWMGMTEHVDAVVTMEKNSKDQYIIMRLDDFINRFIK